MHLSMHDGVMDSCMSKVPSFCLWIACEPEISREIVGTSGFALD